MGRLIICTRCQGQRTQAAPASQLLKVYIQKEGFLPRCYQTQVRPLAIWKPILERQVTIETERLLYSGGWQPGEMADLCPKANSKDSAWPWKCLKRESFGEGVRVSIIFYCVQTFFWLVGGEVAGRYFRNLVLSRKLPSSLWVGALVPIEELNDIIIYINWGGTRTLPHGCSIVPDYSSLVSAFPPFPDKQLFESALLNSGKVKEAERSLFPTNKKFVPRKDLYPEGPAGSCSIS